MRAFVTRRQLATWLGVKTPTVGAWDRRGKGVGGKGPIYRAASVVVYEREDVEKFLESLGVSPAAFIPPQANGAGARNQDEARSGFSEARSEAGGAPVLAERRGRE